MEDREKIYNIFNREGRLIQIEYGLEAVNNAYQINTIATDNEIICVAKRHPASKLCVSIPTSVYTIAENIYMHITGLPADIDHVIQYARKLASSLEFKLGCILTPDVFARELAGKFQVMIQRSGKRSPAFAASICGFEKNSPMIYYTDLSAVCNPVYAIAAGEDTNKCLKYLEKHYEPCDRNKAIKLGISTLLESIGKNAEYTEIEVVIISKEGLFYLKGNNINEFLQVIAEEQ